jgi:protein-S-isoprenylcysteine O-methyltransferase Ste14
MTCLRTIELGVCVAALSGFGWGMTRFFEKPSGHTMHTRMVALLGIVFATCHVWELLVSPSRWWRDVTGIALYVVAIALFVWAVRSCRQRPLTAIFETDMPRHLVREGPYRYVRHPFYTAYILFWTAGWIASASPIALVSAMVMATVYIRAAFLEETKFRRSPLAADHAQYCRTVGFLVPHFGRTRWLMRSR